MQEHRLGASQGILTTAYMNVVGCIAQGVSIRTVLQWIRWGRAVYWCQFVEQWDEMDTSLVRAKCQGFLSVSSLASIVLCWPALYTAGRRNSSHIVCSVLATFCLHKSVCFCYDITHTHVFVPIVFVGQDISCYLCRQHFIDHIHRLFGSTRLRARPLTVHSVCGWPCGHCWSTWCQSSFICWWYTVVPSLSSRWHHHCCRSAERVHRWYQSLDVCKQTQIKHW